MQLLHCSSLCPLSILSPFPDAVHLCLALCNSGINGLHINNCLDSKLQHSSRCSADGHTFRCPAHAFVKQVTWPWNDAHDGAWQLIHLNDAVKVVNRSCALNCHCTACAASVS